MSDNQTEASSGADAHGRPQEPGATESGDLMVEEELLIEEISIDGMCGVY